MALQCGIVGLPNVGKSTLFNALTSAKALAANYPFATKEPNLGMITVPDPRLDKLAELVDPEKITPTTVEIVDIAGLIKGASKGEGLGNQFLANIREVDAIVHVVRCFEDDNIVHVEGSIDPVRDKVIIDNELILRDLETVEKRLDKFKKNSKTAERSALQAVEFAQQIFDHLYSGAPARSLALEGDGIVLLKDMQLLTAKPVLYVCNVDEGSVNHGNALTKTFEDAVKSENAQVIYVSAGIEAEIADLDTKEERLEYSQAMGLEEPGVNKLIRSCYKLLDLVTYFTAGVQEVRAWTIRKGTLAPQAAGVIHSDIEKGFIRAEVIKYAEYIHYKTEAAVKDAGKMSLEGKEYEVKDGDVIYFRFNV